MNKDEFEQIVLDTLKELPDKFKEKIKNLDIVIEENDVQPDLKNKKSGQIKFTLGLYQGVPATKKPGKINIMPDKITIYKKALEKPPAAERGERQRRFEEKADKNAV